MKPKRVLFAVASLIALLVVVFLVASFLVGAGSFDTVVDVARSKCIKDGFPAQNMIAYEVTVDNGMFGFGGRATVRFGADGSFGPDGKRRMEPLELRVELRRRMNLSEWEVVSISHADAQ
jgi:hypothetical protein